MYKFFATLIQTRKIVITNHVPFSVICTDIQFLKSFARVCDTIIYYYYYYIFFCKGRTIPNKSLSLEIFIYLLRFRDVLYLEGRSCALPSSGSLLIYPVFPLGADHLTLEGGGGVILKKKIPASACQKKNTAFSTNEIESLWGKKGKKISCPPDC